LSLISLSQVVLECTHARNNRLCDAATRLVSNVLFADGTLQPAIHAYAVRIILTLPLLLLTYAVDMLRSRTFMFLFFHVCYVFTSRNFALHTTPGYVASSFDRRLSHHALFIHYKLQAMLLRRLTDADTLLKDLPPVSADIDENWDAEHQVCD
jgi:hypothetical protein